MIRFTLVIALVVLQHATCNAQTASETLERLGQRHERLRAELRASADVQIDPTLDDESWLAEVRKTSALASDALASELLDLIERHAGTKESFDSIVYLMRHGCSTIDTESATWKACQTALGLAKQQFSTHQDFDVVTRSVADFSLPSDAAERFLRSTAQDSPHSAVRVAASLHLAKYLQNQRNKVRLARRLQRKDSLSEFERFWKLSAMPLVLPPRKSDQELTDEIHELLRLIMDEGRGLSLKEIVRHGAGNMRWRRSAKPTTTYEKAAREMAEALDAIAPGLPAPDIVGRDARGKEFRLSDFCGKVVLLNFSAKWCLGCVKMYPFNRDLIREMEDEPFVLLGVNGDKDKATLQAWMDAGVITWRCWWDGHHGAYRFAMADSRMADLYSDRPARHHSTYEPVPPQSGPNTECRQRTRRQWWWPAT